MKKKFYETLIKKINPDYIEESYRELIENWESIDYLNKFDLALSESCTKELMKKNNAKWNDTEIKFLITFMVNQYINRLPRKEKIIFTFPKKSRNKVDASCKHHEHYYELFYYPEIFEQLRSSNPNVFLRGIRSVFHEAVHIFQNTIVNREKMGEYSSKEDYDLVFYLFAQSFLYEYLMNPEQDLCQKDLKDYQLLFHENHAEKMGYKEACAFLKKYAPNKYQVYSEEKINQNRKRYEDVLDSYLSLDLRGDLNTLAHDIEFVDSNYIKKHPDVLNRFPVLSIAYFENGKRRTTMDLLEKRKEMLQNGYSEEQINSLFTYLIDYRSYTAEEYMEEKKVLPSYVRMYRVPDQYTRDMLKKRSKFNSTVDQIEDRLVDEIQTGRKK